MGDCDRPAVPSNTTAPNAKTITYLDGGWHKMPEQHRRSVYSPIIVSQFVSDLATPAAR